MDDLQWPRILNKVITQKWSQLKNTLVMKDFVDYLIQKRVVTLDYWMGLKTKPITESERTEDFLALVIKFDQQKYNHFLEALLAINRNDLVKDLVKAQSVKPRTSKARVSDGKMQDNHQRKASGTDAEQSPQHSATDVPIRQSKSMLDGQTMKTEKTLPRSASFVLSDTSVNKEMKRNKTPAALDNDEKSATSVNKDLKQNKTRAVNDHYETVPHNQKQAQLYKSTVVEKLHKGIGTVDKNDKGRKFNAELEENGCVTPNSKSSEKLTKDAAINERESKATSELHNKTGKVTKDSKDAKNTSHKERPDTGQSREEILDRKEESLNSKESELIEKELQLKKHEEDLKQKETELLTRENSLLTRSTKSEVGPLPFSPGKLLREIQQGESSSEPPSAFTTQSSDILTDVREQLAAMRKVKEIDSEHTMTTSCSPPKEEYVKLQDFQAVQQDIEELKEEIVSDRSIRQTVQQKMEVLKQEIEQLQRTIENLESENEESKIQLNREINKLKIELKNMKSDNNESINRLKMDVKTKAKECAHMKTEVEDITKHSSKLEQRVEVLEREKSRYEKELQRYEKEVSDLRSKLEAKKKELEDLRKVLEDTENEKDDLNEELAILKTEVARLKADRKKLEQEKKTLLGRCVKPQWSQSRRTSFQ